MTAHKPLNPQFLAIVHKDADSAYGVSFPDLPGCFSAADTEEELLPNAIEALALWFEDEELVQPRAAADVIAASRDQLTEGAFLMAVPLIRSTGKMVRVNLSMDRGMLDAIDAAAATRRLTRSAFLQDLARKEILGQMS